jgi:NADH dehydrogenase
MDGVQGVIHCAAVTSASGSPAELSWRVNVQGTRLLLEAARRAGVARWIQISSMSAHPASTSIYGKTKLAADALLRRDYPDPPPAWTILRPSLIYGPGGQGLVAKTLALARRLPVLPMVGSGQELLRPVLARDVAKGALRCLELEQVKGQTYIIGGADQLTLEAFMRRLLTAAGLRRPMARLPIPLCMILARFLGACVKKPPITVDNVLGVKESLPTDHARAVREWGWSPAGVEEGLALTNARPDA